MINFLTNSWTITIAGGAVASVIAAFFIRDKSKTTNIVHAEAEAKAESSPIQIQTSQQKVVVHNHLHGVPNTPQPTSTKEFKAINYDQVASLKLNTKILFVDDIDLKTKINNLKDAGWQRVSQIKDAPNIDIADIQDADVIFVDYKGIGTNNSNNQGLGVLAALKQRYSDTKWLILYSAHKVPVNAFDFGANSYLVKNSSLYELEQKIIEGAQRVVK